MHCNRFLVNKTNRCTEIQFYWYYDSTCFGQPFCPSSGVLRCTAALVHFMQFWWLYVTRSRMELEFHPTPGSKRSSQLHKMYQSLCTSKNSWWAERLPETCRVVIPIKLDFSASFGFIHKECHYLWTQIKWLSYVLLGREIREAVQWSQILGICECHNELRIS